MGATKSPRPGYFGDLGSDMTGLFRDFDDLLDTLKGFGGLGREASGFWGTKYGLKRGVIFASDGDKLLARLDCKHCFALGAGSTLELWLLGIRRSSPFAF